MRMKRWRIRFCWNCQNSYEMDPIELSVVLLFVSVSDIRCIHSTSQTGKFWWSSTLGWMSNCWTLLLRFCCQQVCVGTWENWEHWWEKKWNCGIRNFKILNLHTETQREERHCLWAIPISAVLCWWHLSLVVPIAALHYLHYRHYIYPRWWHLPDKWTSAASPRVQHSKLFTCHGVSLTSPQPHCCAHANQIINSW